MYFVCLRLCLCVFLCVCVRVCVLIGGPFGAGPSTMKPASLPVLDSSSSGSSKARAYNPKPSWAFTPARRCSPVDERDGAKKTSSVEKGGQSRLERWPENRCCTTAVSRRRSLGVLAAGVTTNTLIDSRPRPSTGPLLQLQAA